jgi:NADH pyrophosphatase NudC (nudix superfamily)
MNKIIVFCFAMLVSLNTLAMQQQQQKQKRESADANAMADKQQKEVKRKQRWYSNDKENPSKQLEQPSNGSETDNLNAMLSGIMNQINQEYGSVTNMIENLKHQEHQRICPTCGRPAEICETDRDRIAHGDVMLCGCPICGGLQV